MDEREYTITLNETEVDMIINALHMQYIRYAFGENVVDVVREHAGDYSELCGKVYAYKMQQIFKEEGAACGHSQARRRRCAH